MTEVRRGCSCKLRGRWSNVVVAVVEVCGRDGDAGKVWCGEDVAGLVQT